MDRRDLLKAMGGTLLLGGSCALAVRRLTTSSAGVAGTNSPLDEKTPLTGKIRKMGMVIDVSKCQPDCTACLDACRQENNVAFLGDSKLDVHWIRKVKIRKKPEEGDTAREPPAAEKSVILLCNHCDKPPCAQVCPVRATFKRKDGIVLVDHHRCIGCRYCMIACPYNARYFNCKEDVNFEHVEEWPNPDRPRRSHGVAESCTLCAHRLDAVDEDGKPQPQVPACVEACPSSALAIGDMNDPASTVYELLRDFAVKRLKEDLGTEPKVHYIGL